jgi:UDP-N-acetylmuramoyl-L-alanyl-D-glutamate--2,6-diaminopimelate ligase
MNLSEVLKGVSVTKMFQTMYGKMVITHDVKVSGIQYDSRNVERENMFVAIKGTGSDGHSFLSSAIANGAKVIVIENDAAIPDSLCMHQGVVKVVVGSTRKALAQISANYYGRPASSMTMIGVTGTNGKTTTTYLIKQMLESDPANKVGLIGTVEYAIGSDRLPATHTTPESLELHRLFSQMKQQQCTHVVMEVSSHALHQYRVFGIPFAAAVFTNLTQDHLDYHGTMEEYFSAKKILFNSLDSGAVAVINADTEYGTKIVDSTAAGIRSYGIRSVSDVRASHVTVGIDGCSLSIDERSMSLQLVGLFNVYNFLAAYTTVTALGNMVPDATLTNLVPAPGRFEQIRSRDGWTAIVDYAHTPDALENCLQTIHDVLAGNATARIITVFGAGGDRDRTKRPMMGAVVERLSHVAIVTSDNPRTEDPRRIIEDILAGMNDSQKAIVEIDRSAAIRKGLSLARSGDAVLIAGKGHEEYQVLGTEKIHFSDKEEIVRHLNGQL